MGKKKRSGTEGVRLRVDFDALERAVAADGALSDEEKIVGHLEEAVERLRFIARVFERAVQGSKGGWRSIRGRVIKFQGMRLYPVGIVGGRRIYCSRTGAFAYKACRVSGRPVIKGGLPVFGT